MSYLPEAVLSCNTKYSDVNWEKTNAQKIQAKSLSLQLKLHWLMRQLSQSTPKNEINVSLFSKHIDFGKKQNFNL